MTLLGVGGVCQLASVSRLTPSRSDLCDLTLLKPLWQLFTHMEYSLFEDVTQPGILLPLHRALTELFLVTENRAQVSGEGPAGAPPLPGLRAKPWGVVWVAADLRRGQAWPEVRILTSAPPRPPRNAVLSGLKPRGKNCPGSVLDSSEFWKIKWTGSSFFLLLLPTSVVGSLNL